MRGEWTQRAAVWQLEASIAWGRKAGPGAVLTHARDADSRAVVTSRAFLRIGFLSGSQAGEERRGETDRQTDRRSEID